MKLPILLFAATMGVASLGLAGGALAQGAGKTTTICLDGTGRLAAPACKVYGGGSRLETHEDACVCPGATREVTAAVCPSGVNPPGESTEYAQARLKAIHNGKVEGSWQGQPMCVASNLAH